jgi:hypothetical protein
LTPAMLETVRVGLSMINFVSQGAR